MDTLRGKVSNIRHAADVSGNKDAISTTHIAVFDLDGKAVQFAGDTAGIDNGDEVAVAGYHQHGTLYALAFRNFTKGTEGDQLWRFWLVFGVGLVMYGFFTALVFESLDTVFVGMLATAVGILFILRELRAWRAREMVRRLLTNLPLAPRR